MSHFSPLKRAAAAAALGTAITLASVGATAAPALAKATKTTAGHDSSSAGESVSANFYAGDFAVQFSAQRAAGAAADQATGTFSAQALIGTSSVASLAGPVTCLDQEGADIGLFYPVTSSSPTALGELLKGVYVTLELGKSGQPLSMSFRPSLSAGASSCAPAVGMIPILSGTATVNGTTGTATGF